MMAFPDWFRRKQLVKKDPVFGRLTYDSSLHCWRGEVAFEPTGESVLVDVDCDEAGPTQDHRDGFGALKQRYAELMPALSVALYERCILILDVEMEDLPRPHSAAEMWSMVTLDSVSIESADAAAILFSPLPDLKWGDLFFTIKLKNWLIEEVRADD